MTDKTLLQSLQAIKASVDARIVYDNSGTAWQLPDWTWVEGHGRGDCSVFAETYYRICKAAGLDAQAHLGMVKQGGHAWCVVGPYTLDVRFDQVRLAVEGGYLIDYGPRLRLSKGQS